ncbi:MAG TPA: tetratricopeptide repeat protein [Kofleriaceae bacterium]|nr:tetratricopeptide repeat protein [Kofleriaceae bacterium]
MRSLWGQVAIAAALLTTLARDARADALADARKAVEGSDYMAAQPALETALKAGTAGPAELAEIYKLTGIVEAALGNAGPSEKAFAKWLALDPKGALPEGTSPKITRPFDAAHAQANKSGPLEAKAETQDTPPAVTLKVANDPQKMIVAAKVYFIVDGKSEQTLSADGRNEITIELGLGKRIDLRIHGLDRYGNRVVELGSKDVPIVITSSGKETPVGSDRVGHAKPKTVEPEKPRPWYLQWWLWGGATVAVTGVGGYFAYRTYDNMQTIEHLHATSLDHPWSDEQSVERSARRNLLVTNIAAGTAGAFAIVTTILFLTRPNPESESAMRATLTPTHGGAAVVLGGHF